MPFQQAFCSSFKSTGLTLSSFLNFSSRANSSSFSRLVVVAARPLYRLALPLLLVLLLRFTTTVALFVFEDPESVTDVSTAGLTDDDDDGVLLCPLLSFVVVVVCCCCRLCMYWSDEIDVGCCLDVCFCWSCSCCGDVTDVVRSAFPGPFTVSNV